MSDSACRLPYRISAPGACPTLPFVTAKEVRPDEGRISQYGALDESCEVVRAQSFTSE